MRLGAMIACMLASSALVLAVEAPSKIPLRAGLMVVTAISRQEGDYV